LTDITTALTDVKDFWPDITMAFTDVKHFWTDVTSDWAEVKDAFTDYCTDTADLKRFKADRSGKGPGNTSARLAGETLMEEIAVRP